MQFLFSPSQTNKRACGRLLLRVLNSRRFGTYYLRGFVGDAGAPHLLPAAIDCAMKNGFH